MSKLTIGFAGLTHLGTCSSIAASLNGNSVVAFDFNDQIVKERVSGKFDSAEPGVEKFLRNLPDDFQLTNNVLDLVKCDLVIISVDSPVDKDGHVDTEPVKKFYEVLTKRIKREVPIIILSQVRPGFTRSLSESRNEVYYQMETLIFGEGLERALKPERYVVGLRDESEALNPRYEEFLMQSNCPIMKMSLESAELTKLSANFILASMITATNTLAELSSRVGGNWRQIAESLRMDRRIGKYAYLNAGLGLGGSNIIRDLIGIREMSSIVGSESSIVDSMLLNSVYSMNWLTRQIIEVLQKVKTPKIGIIGLSYKPNTNSTIGSCGIMAAKIFAKAFTVYVFDPVIKSHVELEDTVKWTDCAKEVAENVEILIISTAWPEFKTDEFYLNIKNSNIKYLIDPFGCQIVNFSEQYEYRTLGTPTHEKIT